MTDLINFFDFIKDFVGPTELTFIVIVALISFYFSNKKNQKDLVKVTSSIDTSLEVLSNSILAMNNSSKELVLNLTSSSNDLTKSIVSGVTNSLMTIKAQEKNAHDELLKKGVDTAIRIRNELDHILLVTQADLVILTQLHNGETNFNGIPFIRYDIIDQTTSTNALQISGQLNCRPISEYALIYSKVLESPTNTFWGNSDELEEGYDDSIAARLAKIHKASLICVGLFNKSNTLYAFINILFNDRHLTEDFVQNININRYKYLIENILSQQA